MSDQFNYAINVDLPPGLLESEKFSAHLEELLMDVAKTTRDFWEATAGRTLKTSRDAYQRAIGMVQTGKYEVTVQLMGSSSNMGSSLVVAIETGGAPFDMKPGFLRSPNIKKKRIPRAIAENLKQRTGQQAATRWMVIPLNYTGAQPGPGGKVANPIFRMFTNTQPSNMWIHPGFPGVHIADTVFKELTETILPTHIEKLIDEALT